MASLNWVQLTASPTRPIPLPDEEPLMAPLKSIQLSLHPASSTASSSSTSSVASLSATGTVYLSNHRIVFVRDGASSTNAAGDDAEESSSLRNGSASIVRPTGPDSGAIPMPTRNAVLNTLSMPFTHFVDGKYNQPFFGTTYYSARLIPASGGGLDGPYLVKIAFKEGGGFAFYEKVESMKSRVLPFDRVAHVDPLPLYTPPPPPVTSVPSTSSRSSEAPLSSDQILVDIATPAVTATPVDPFQYDQDAIPLLPMTASSSTPSIPRDGPPDYYGMETTR